MDGSVWSSGAGGLGQHGDGTSAQKTTFTQVLPAGSAAAIAANGDGSFVLKPDGTLWATGANSSGQLGLGAVPATNVFTQVLSGVAQVSPGWWHTAALKTDGTVWVTGASNGGALGLGDTANRQLFTQVTEAAP